MIYLRSRHGWSIHKLLAPSAVLLILLWVFVGDPAAAAEPQWQSVPMVREAAVSHAQQASPAGAQLQAGRLDERLRLAACPAALMTRTASETPTAMSVEVRCESASTAWKLFVPVSVRVQVPVLVASRGLARGQSVGAGDVDVQMRDRANLGPAWLSSPDDLRSETDGTARVLSRAVAAGSVLSPSQFANARVVRRGQSVTLVSRSGGFEVRAQGKALSDAGTGERVRVENLSSRRVVEGEVRADGSVSVAVL
ncbi:MAG: flagellar basal body P-ring biosynthesis protein FlgA [Panacagrimonas sp.]|nr:flagellar basal body P-ring biosynthesis protein FlgA [Panacagrimonas sp.]